MPGSRLLSRIQEIATKVHFGEIAVAFHDFESALRFSYQGDRWFHAASTFKAGILFAFFKAAEEGRIRIDDHLQVRNRFVSVANGGIYRVQSDRDGDSTVHKRVGRSMRLLDLATVMITRSSNLATNLLLDFLSVDFVRRCLRDAGVEGVEIRRGVEDLAAHEAKINNEATADGLLRLFRVFLDEKHLAEPHRAKAMEILLAQEFKSMLPGKLPHDVRVAHKTGEISTHCHDVGIVLSPGRQPYVVAIMTETTPETEKRSRGVAEISATIYRYIVGSGREEKHPP